MDGKSVDEMVWIFTARKDSRLRLDHLRDLVGQGQCYLRECTVCFRETKQLGSSSDLKTSCKIHKLCGCQAVLEGDALADIFRRNGESHLTDEVQINAQSLSMGRVERKRLQTGKVETDQTVCNDLNKASGPHQNPEVGVREGGIKDVDRQEESDKVDGVGVQIVCGRKRVAVQQAPQNGDGNRLRNAERFTVDATGCGKRKTTESAAKVFAQSAVHSQGQFEALEVDLIQTKVIKEFLEDHNVGKVRVREEDKSLHHLFLKRVDGQLFEMEHSREVWGE